MFSPQHSIGITSRGFERRLLAVVLAAVLLLAASPVSAVAEVRSADLADGKTAKEVGIPSAAMPDVEMAAGALVTADGRVLWQRRASDRRAMASITKIMTAVVALEHATPNDIVTVPRDSMTVGESTSFLRAGEKLPLYELLEALLVKSGNDAAIAIAEHVGGSEEGFVTLMNDKAAELGLSRTHFANAHGLDAKDHYTSALDLATLARYAMAKPEIRQIVGQKVATIGTGKRSEKVENTNLLIGNYQGALGIKTGWTGNAGYCVLDTAERGGVELYAVVLGTTNELQRFRDARELLDWGFAHYRPQRLASAGTVVGQAPVLDYLDLSVPAAVSADTTVSVFDLAGPITRSVSVSAVRAPVDKAQRVGVVTYTQAGTVIASIPLVATQAVAEPNPLQKVGIAIVRGWRRIAGGQMSAAG